MKRISDFIIIPFIIFVLLVVAVVGFKVLLFAITLVARILVGLGTYAVNGFPDDLAYLFSDPIKIIALPIAIGLVIALGYCGLNMDTGSDNFIRGRRMGKRPRRDPHRGSNRPSTLSTEKKSLPAPSIRKNGGRRR